MREMQARMTTVLGLHRTVSRDSIASFAGSFNTKKDYQKFVKRLFETGVTADMISQKQEEIQDMFNPQNTATSSQIDGSPMEGQSQLPGAGCSNAETSLYMSSH